MRLLDLTRLLAMGQMSSPSVPRRGWIPRSAVHRTMLLCSICLVLTNHGLLLVLSHRPRELSWPLLASFKTSGIEVARASNCSQHRA